MTYANRFPASVPISALNEESLRSYHAHMDMARRRWPQLASSASYRSGVRQRLLDYQNGKPWVDPR